MSDKQKRRYYWLKLKEDFFEEDTIEWLEEQPNGKEYCLFYLKLCLKSLKTEGLLVRNVGNLMIPYDPESLAKLTNSNADTVKVAMDLFNKIGLIKILDGGEIYLNQLSELVGSETEYARQKRIQRAKEDNVQKLSGKGRLELELEKELDIEKDKEIEKEDEEDDEEGIGVYEFIQKSWGKPPTGILQGALGPWIRDWGSEMILFAFQSAYENSVEMHGLKKYVDKIFATWKANNVSTLQDAVKAKEDWEAKKNQKTFPNSRAKRHVTRKEPEPKWLADYNEQERLRKEREAHQYDDVPF
ncbi:phage replisome organizer N-terminal domain-containing protein [Enterococcus mundtii]|uniref:phage replisome organizer N-terminal domain-containing protein n=1 Tax=Enterococcus mundtii TaxID=53346 RepID=UPI0009D66FAA|nr:phage replisome organizer N-terminal domain-containing protein [Enterococcus mundtii]